ncbi:hypothetical protein DBR44_05475 [Aquitalea sp. FJL05]|uniref:hypothetical protein n=1 Tax=Aquitalea sp. FJL05 TaxID=2153366 RepID=UPI000F59D415|nr:hypothetical protein [Aquitalea sp. FJL05]RQO76137.1 hypothetical protein DBR44_05475 [Aquitalea sp. FJL05]
MDNSIIEIDLSSSNYNHPIDRAKLIQREAFEKLQQQIREDLGHANAKVRQAAGQTPDAYTNDLYPPGSGLTYFIDGTRGAGKSTFLDFTYKYLEAKPASDAASVKPLLYLDPSRIEASEIVLLHILKHLKYLMEECSHRGPDWSSQQEKFRDLFKQMAGGLQLFVSKTDNLKDLDAELFLDYGLDRAADSQQLRRLLHQTIDLVCKAYNTRALLVAIDDADTKFTNAIEVLECIRKYLDTPQLLLLVTGDMEMYSLLVQNHFQQDFANDSKGFTDDRKTQQTRMVAHLEEQYLLKLFPVQRRVQLRTLHTLIERKRKGDKPEGSSTPAFIVKKSGDGDAAPLLEAIDAIATEGLRLRDGHDLDLFREHVLKQPVRSVLQLLAYYYQLRSDIKTTAREAAAEALRATALSSLYRQNIDVESIAEGDLHALIDAAFDLCQSDGEPDTAIYLRPQSRDATLRHAYPSLAADVARLCENDPAKAITYMVSMAGSSKILHLVTVKGNKASEGELQRKVKQYLSVGRQDNALNWAWHATAALIGANTNKSLPLRQGIIGVRVSKKNDAVSFDYCLNQALKECSKDTYPAIAFTQSAVKYPDNTRRYLSIFNTLGLIANLLGIHDSEKGEDEIRRQLNKILSIPTVSMPKWDTETSMVADIDDGETNDDDQDLPQGFTNLVGQIKAWLTACQEIKRHFYPSAMLMGKIWNRLHFSLDNISAAMRSSSHEEERSTKAMELFAWALINACLVEEVDYHYQSEPSARGELNRKNPRTAGALVMAKFQHSEDAPPSAEEAQKKAEDVTPSMAPLTFMIAACPLVLGLIKSDKATQDFIKLLNASLKTANISLVIPGSALCSAEVWVEMAKTTLLKQG